LPAGGPEDIIRFVGLRFVALLFSQWQMQLVCGLLVLLLPLVSYLAYVKPRRPREEALPPAEKALRQSTKPGG
jgi:hypothetical protein